MSYTPEPGTDWKDLDPAKLYNIVDAFKNEAVYAAGQKLLGDAITDFATGLLVGGGTESTPSGIFYSSGCVPHACGGADAFMAVDAEEQGALPGAAERGSAAVGVAGARRLAGRREERHAGGTRPMISCRTSGDIRCAS